MTRTQWLALVLVILVGCFLAWQFWLIWTLHQQNGQLEHQVCVYQQIIERQLGHVPLPCG